jgi:hypothetical protein
MPAVIKADAPAAPPGMRFVNPFALYAASEGDAFFSGDYVLLDQKLGWVRGEGKRPLDTTGAFVADMQGARRGWIKFNESGPAERKTVRIAESPEPPRRKVCGDMNKLDWPIRGGERRDPWLPVVCRCARSQIPTMSCALPAPKDPVILPESRSFRNESGGTTAWPIFNGSAGTSSCPACRRRRW